MPPLRVLAWVGIVAATVRLLYLTEHAASPLFAFPVLDQLYYDTVARLLRDGRSVAEIDPGFRPLLYPWLMSNLYALSAEWGRILVFALQHLLGIATALLTAITAWRLTASAGSASAAGILFALAGPPLFFEGELLTTALITFLLSLFTASLVTLDPGAQRWASWMGTGALLGLAAQVRPNALVLAPVLALPVAREFLRGGPEHRRHLARPLLALASLLVVLVLFAAWQTPHFGSFQLLTSSGGVNLYLGNKRGADGMIPRQDVEITYGASYLDSVEVFARSEAEAGRPRNAPPLSPAAISRHWTRRALAEIAADPIAWGGLMARKVWLLLWTVEIPNNKTYAFVTAEESRLLALLPVRWWMLLALSPLGIAAILRRPGSRSGLASMLGVVTLWSLGIVLFFVNSRYRVPIWPPLCVLAGSGGALAWHGIVARDWRRLAVPVAVGGVLAGLSLGNWLGIPPFPLDRDYFYRSLAHLDRGQLDEAAQDARRAAAMRPKEAVYMYQIGAVELAAGRPAEAAAAFRAAGELKPNEPRVWNGLGLALQDRGSIAQAYASFLRAIELAPDFVPSLANAALLELRAGLVERASSRLEQAELTAEETDVPVLCARAFLARERGQFDEAARLLSAASEKDPILTELLAAENENRLTRTQLGIGAEG